RCGGGRSLRRGELLVPDQDDFTDRLDARVDLGPNPRVRLDELTLRVDRDRPREEEQPHGDAYQNADDEHEAVEELLVLVPQSEDPLGSGGWWRKAGAIIAYRPGETRHRKAAADASPGRGRRSLAAGLPERPVEEAKLQRLADIGLADAVAAVEVRNRPRDLHDPHAAAHAELPLVDRALQEREGRGARARAFP